MTITFNVPVVVNGLIPLSIAGISGVPVQAVVDAQTVTQTYGESVAGNALAAGRRSERFHVPGRYARARERHLLAFLLRFCRILFPMG